MMFKAETRGLAKLAAVEGAYHPLYARREEKVGSGLLCKVIR